MLRVSPDGKVIWVQTAGANSNVVLDVDSMDELHTEPAGKGPVQSAFGTTAGRYGLLTHLEENFVLVLERESGRTAQRIDVGGAQANASFTPDGATAFVTVPSKNEVVAIDMAELAVVGCIPAGGEPMGIVLLDASG
jgi:YVTN family beta-propeller protein